jgi:VWFA-related protein
MSAACSARRRRRSAARHWLGAALLASALAASLAAQAASPQNPPARGDGQPSQRPVIRTEANYVRVDAYPTVGGQPVLDLKAEDFEVLEEGVPQKIQAFEHVIVRPAGPQALRVEPNSIEASRQLVANPRNRVFVLFLDVGHTTIDGTWHSRHPLVRLVDRILGPDDLVGIMTPDMAPSQIVFARKTQVLSAGLRDIWPWGERHTLARDDRERLYESCYTPLSQDLKAGKSENPVVREMRLRRREKMTLEALRNLVDYMRHLREERTAILTVTEGWLLYRPNEALATLRTDEATGYRERAPEGPPVGVGPDGRLRLGSQTYPPGSEGFAECDQDRITLAHLDNDRFFRDLLGAANRANASFYTIDPRGLPVWDNPIGPEPPPPITVDQDMLKVRRDSMHVLANETDGMAMPLTNNLDAPLKKIADDLTSYYLLGYYSTNAKLDGRYRRLEVRVKRPGVDVRARRGYRAPTEAEVRDARAATAAAPAGPPPEIAGAFAELARVRDDAAFVISAGPRRDASSRVMTVWVAGEIRRARGEAPPAKPGVVDLQVTGGGARGEVQLTIAAGQRAFLAEVPLDQPAEGAIDVRARLTGLTVVPFTDTVRIEPGAGGPQPVVYRRGPATGIRYEPAGTMLFTRTERVRLEVPLASGASASGARVLDRSGQPLQVPVTLSERTDDGGRRVAVADLTLAPLTLGDYAIEITIAGGDNDARAMTAIRIGR